MPTAVEALTSLALDAMPQAVLVAAEGGQIVLRNASARLMLPPGPDLDAAIRVTGPERFDWAGRLEALSPQAGLSVARNVALSGSQGRRMLADIYLRRIDDPRGALVVVEDVSVRASMEQERIADERMTAVAKLTAQVAHELNNPLDGVLRYIGLAKRTAGSDAQKYLDGARNGLGRMGDIIRGLLASTSGTGGPVGREGLDRLLDEAINVMQPRAETQGVTVMMDLEERASIPVGPNFFQVICNLIKNALDAMPGGGLLKVSLTRRDERCVLEFADTGVGLTPQQTQRLFQPFQSSKPQGEGLGLGLVVCREIVTAAGGTISVAPRPEGGAVVTISLPA